ncbi:poly polymerase [Olea europaea subsp. europaea]|uniref:Poly polymerase n=1 Tax=Olea europaea subsp. europaea TaxID=158383 RepID=A0A8S0Q1F5_OLEEU|nr:poly polymerase [Olea europaea subsp. europaea]
MGACLSSKSLDYQIPSANVVLMNGELRQFSIPTTVAQVSEFVNSALGSFICNSDCLYFNDYIPALAPEDALEESQIYFVLPNTKLLYRLTASDMAALAVKASFALDKMNAAASTQRRKRKSRISPVMGLDQNIQPHQKKSSVNNNNATKPSTSAQLGVSRSRSVRKLQKYSSRRAKMTAQSFRVRLSTIYEGSVAYAPVN